jgi:hypothetical protein
MPYPTLRIYPGRLIPVLPLAIATGAMELVAQPALMEIVEASPVGCPTLKLPCWAHLHMLALRGTQTVVLGSSSYLRHSDTIGVPSGQSRTIFLRTRLGCHEPTHFYEMTLDRSPRLP